MFVLFLSVIHYTFRNTKYNYPKWIKILYLVPSVLIPVILIIMTTIDQWIVYDHQAFKFRRYLDHINTIILCLFSTYLFCNVLGRVAWKQVKYSDENKTEAVAKATKLLNMMVKYTILVFVIIIFALSVMIMDELTWNGITFGISIEKWVLIVFILYYIDCFVNIFCVYLRYSFSSRIYDKICIYAHKYMLTAVVGCMKKKYDRHNVKENIQTSIALSIAATTSSSPAMKPNPSTTEHTASIGSDPSTLSPAVSPRSKQTILSDSEYQD